MEWIGEATIGGRRNEGAIAPHDAQYPGVDSGASKRSVVLGLDFGTAFTKIVIADNRRAYATVFHKAGRGVSRYLLPSEVGIDANGVASLVVRDGVRRFSDLKLRILNGDTHDDVIHATVAFLALAIREARQAFMVDHRDEFGVDRLVWQLNIGLPADRCGSGRLTSFYRALARAAWHASVRPAPVTASLAEDCYLGEGGPLDDDAIGLVPEFAAQICGYVRSSMRQEGAHLLIDVGGGTLDVAVFNVFHDAENADLFPVFAGIVEPLGVLRMHQRRVSALESDGVSLTARTYVEASSYASAAMHLSVPVELLKKADVPFRDQVRGQVVGALQSAKDKKYPRLYRQPVRVFLCGGGARVELYQRIVHNLVNANYPCRLELARLPQVERLEADTQDESVYDRLSVAYGLSFDRYDIGTVRLPHELDSAAPPEDATRHVCAACGGTGGSRRNDCVVCGGSGWLP